MAKKPDSFYFDNYVACADLAVQAAELLTKIFENFDPAKIHDMLNKMHAIEHAADKKHHELEDALLTAFIVLAGIWGNAQFEHLHSGSVLTAQHAVQGIALDGWRQEAPGQWHFTFTVGEDIPSLDPLRHQHSGTAGP